MALSTANVGKVFESHLNRDETGRNIPGYLHFTGFHTKFKLFVSLGFPEQICNCVCLGVPVFKRWQIKGRTPMNS